MLLRAAGLEGHEMQSTLEWIKSHSDQIVFVVDNLTLPDGLSGAQITYDDKETPREIIRSLFFRERKLFPNSQISCTTNQKTLPQIIGPSRILHIAGFQKRQIKEMSTYMKTAVPEHLEYLCIKPGYRKMVASLLRMQHQTKVDIESTASVLIWLLKQSLGKEKAFTKANLLKDKMNEIQRTFRNRTHQWPKPSKKDIQKDTASQSPSGFASTSSAAKELSEYLDDAIMQSLYLGLFCPTKEYKEYLKKDTENLTSLGSNAKIWVLSTGLLREDTAKQASDFFNIIKWKVSLMQIVEKRKSVEQLIKKNFEHMRKRIQSRPQTTLDFMDVIAEIRYYKVVKDKGIKITVKTSHGRKEIDNVSKFVGKIRRDFHASVKIEFEKGIGAMEQILIQNSAARNPEGKILVQLESLCHAQSVASVPIHASSRTRKLSERIAPADSRRIRGPKRSDSQTSAGLSADYSSLHASLTSDIGIPEETDYRSSPVIPRPVEATDPKKFVAALPPNSVQISKVFTISQSVKGYKNSCYASAPIYTTSRQTSRCELLEFVGQEWKAVAHATNTNQVAVFRVKEGGIYVLTQAAKESTSEPIYSMVCRTKFKAGMLRTRISRDDGVSFIAISDVGETEQRFTAMINDQFNIKVSSTTSAVVSEWSFSLDRQFEVEEKSKLIDSKETGIFVCSIFKNDKVISQAIFSRHKEEFSAGVSGRSLEVEVAGKRGEEELKFVAKSLSGGMQVTKWSSQNFITLEGIDPGDQYIVYVYDKQRKLIGKSICQTAKTIYSGRRGTVKTGNCSLEFPKGAIIDSASIEIACYGVNLPSLPKNFRLLAPVMDFRSSQRKFLESVTCKVTLPYVVLEKNIEVDIFRFENDDWEYVCSTALTETKVVEFKCDHFCPYIIIYNVPRSYSVLRNLSWALDIANALYYDQAFNFALGIYLNYSAAKENCERELSERGFQKAPHFLHPISLRLEEDVVRYWLKWGHDEELIGQWEVTLNEAFSRDWFNINVCSIEAPHDAVSVPVKVERSCNEVPPRACSCNLSYNKGNGGPQTPAAINVNQSRQINIDAGRIRINN